MKRIMILLVLLIGVSGCGYSNRVTPPTKPNESADNENIVGEGTSGDLASTTQTASKDTPPSKYKVFTKNKYEYLGFSYVLPNSIIEKLNTGELWAYNETKMNGDLDFDYSMFFFNLASDGNFATESFKDKETYNLWLNTTKRLGAIITINKEYLISHKVESITDCKNNEEISRTSDGKYIIYFCSNDIGYVSELFKSIKVTSFDLKPIPQRVPGTCYNFNILDGIFE
ncbi:MAG: hypothetical protein WBO70_02455 [Erysipelotrichaceae bacterium]